MVLPKLKKCCFVVPLEIGGVIFLVISLMACIGALAFCSVMLPNHAERQNEDNLVLLSMTMFATLSAISNIGALAGVAMKRPSFLQMSLTTNAVFILCILLVCTVTLLFSPWLREHWLFINNSASALNMSIAVILLLSGAVYAFYFLTIVNSLYTEMKITFGNSPIPYNL